MVLQISSDTYIKAVMSCDKEAPLLVSKFYLKLSMLGRRGECTLPSIYPGHGGIVKTRDQTCNEK